MVDALNPMPEDARIEALRRRSSRVRRHLERHVDGLKEQAGQMLDWRHHVREHPWIAISGAFLLGLWLAPSGRRSGASRSSEPSDRFASTEPANDRPSMASSLGETLLHSAIALGGRRFLDSALDQVSNLLQTPREEDREVFCRDDRVE